MRTDTRNMLSVSELSKNVSKVLKSVELGQAQVILKNNRPTAAIIDMATAERIQRLDELEEDMRLMTAALVRMVTDNGNRHDLSDVAADLGIDMNELADN